MPGYIGRRGPVGPAPYLCPMTLAARIDHTQLRPDCTEAQIIQLCAEAAAHGFATVCVPDRKSVV